MKLIRKGYKEVETPWEGSRMGITFRGRPWGRQELLRERHKEREKLLQKRYQQTQRARVRLRHDIKNITIRLFDAVRAANLNAVEEVLLDLESIILNGTTQAAWDLDGIRRMAMNAIDPRDRDSPNCLEIAIQDKNEKLVCILIKAGAQLRAVGSALWHRMWDILVNSGNVEALRLVLQNTGQVGTTMTPLSSTVCGNVRPDLSYRERETKAFW